MQIMNEHPQTVPDTTPAPTDETATVSAPEAPVVEAHSAEGTPVAEAIPVAEEIPAEAIPVAEAAPVTDAAPAAEAPAKAEKPSVNEEGRKRAQAIWERLVNARANGEVVHGLVKSAVKGGLLLDVDGFRAFLPASQVRVAKGTPIESLVKSTVPVKVIDVDEQRKRLVVSHRRAMEQERRAARSTLVQSLKVGEERDATVLRLTDFGAFVDLGSGVDALIPLRELAFERVEKAEDVVHIGEQLKVRVLRVEENGKKIAVSRKGALADPWRDHAELLHQGNVVEGTVVAKEPRLTIELAPGITGTLGDREANPEDYAIGEKVEVMVRSIDHRNRRIRLGTPHAAESFTSSGFAPLGIELGK